MLRFTILIIAVVLAAHVPAHAEEEWHPAPDHLTIGYEDEGKVDASPKACEAFVRDAVEWPEDEISRTAKVVCAARKRHADAYAAMQKSYNALIKQIGEDNRINPGEAAKRLAAMVKACIDHKSNLTTGGHNIAIDIIPNDIAASCLQLGKSLLDAESDWFKVGYTDEHPAP